MLKTALSDFALWYSSTVKNEVSLNPLQITVLLKLANLKPCPLSVDDTAWTRRVLWKTSQFQFFFIDYVLYTWNFPLQQFWGTLKCSDIFLVPALWLVLWGGTRSLLGWRGPFVSFIVWNQSGGISLLTFTFLLRCVVWRRFFPIPRNDQTYLERFKKIVFLVFNLRGIQVSGSVVGPET